MAGLPITNRIPDTDGYNFECIASLYLIIKGLYSVLYTYLYMLIIFFFLYLIKFYI